MLMMLSIAWLSLVGLLLARALRQYSAYEQLRPATEPQGVDWPAVDVIIPARNEASNIAPCLQGLASQDYPPHQLRLFVVDDRSSDGTRQAAQSILDPRLRVIPGAALPEGWMGKPFACRQGALASQPHAGQWLCFMDADTRAQPALLRSALSLASRRGLDMLSLEPFQQLGTFWERLLVPAGFFLLAFSQDLRRVNDPACPQAAANGQFILIRRSAYEAVGGHAAARDQIAEDSALARHLKQAGFRVALIGAEKLLATRMYHGLAQLWEGFSKNLVEMIGGKGRTLVFGLIGIVLALAAVALPLAAWIQVAHGGATFWSLSSAICASLATAVLLGLHTGSALYLRIPFWYGLAFPLGYIVGSALVLTSLWEHLRGRARWKGRVYSLGGAE